MYTVIIAKHRDMLEYAGVFGVVRRQVSTGFIIHLWRLEECCSKQSCLSYFLMADPAKDASNWTEHTHSDGRRYYYNKVGSPALIKDIPNYDPRSFLQGDIRYERHVFFPPLLGKIILGVLHDHHPFAFCSPCKGK